MTIIVLIFSEILVHIIVINYNIFMIRLENLGWIPYIFRISLYCNEIIDDFDNFEDYNQYPLDNYYSDQEYWFEGDD